jgi:zinc metalloprotease ZmpB
VTRSSALLVPVCCAALFLVHGPAYSQLSADGQTLPHSRMDGAGTLRALYNVQDVPHTGTASSVAREYLRTAHVTDPAIVLTEEGTVASPAGSHVRFRQMFNGIPVYQGTVTVSLNRERAVRMMVNNTLPAIHLTTTEPAISSHDAFVAARQRVNANGSPIGHPDDAQLFVYRGENGIDHLAYRVSFARQEPLGDWEVFVDALTAEILSTQDLLVHADQFVRGHGFVYLPDPLSAAHQRYGQPGFADNGNASSDSLDNYRTSVVLDSLTLDSGKVLLKAPGCSIMDIELPNDTVNSASDPDSFFYHRSERGFEAVNAFYHITTAYRRVNALGYGSPELAALRVDPHGSNGRDDSHFSPAGNWIAYGDGGVDDAEDASVIWHEYGHAIQYALCPTWGGGETGALGEGFADYWALSYTRSLGRWGTADPAYNWIFTWDGHNPFWSGRISNDTRTYPFGTQPIHSAGQIWCSALVSIMGELGRDVTDRLALQSMYYLGSGITATDNALAIIQADRDLFGGEHLPTLLYWLSTVKHFIPPATLPHILVVNDGTPSSNVNASQSGPVAGKNAAAVLRLGLPESGYEIQMTSFATMDTAQLPQFSLIVLSAGSNDRPFDDSTRRAAIIRYVRAGGKVVVEGGEVGYYFQKDPAGNERDSDFRRTILHDSTFVGNAESSSLLSTGSRSPIFTTPNILPESIEFALQGNPADRDAVLLNPADPMTVGMGTWSALSGAPGMIAHLASDGTVATLFLPFAIAAITDSSTAAALAQNVITYALNAHVELTGITQGGEAFPQQFSLAQNYPNPFNPTTAITYTVPVGTRHAVSLHVYDMLGRDVATLVEGQQIAGVHAVQFNAGNLASGTYLYRLEAGAFSTTKKMLLIR